MADYVRVVNGVPDPSVYDSIRECPEPAHIIAPTGIRPVTYVERLHELDLDWVVQEMLTAFQPKVNYTESSGISINLLSRKERYLQALQEHLEILTGDFLERDSVVRTQVHWWTYDEIPLSYFKNTDGSDSAPHGYVCVIELETTLKPELLSALYEGNEPPGIPHVMDFYANIVFLCACANLAGTEPIYHWIEEVNGTPPQHGYNSRYGLSWRREQNEHARRRS